jgi:DNA replication protein DnaC
MQILLIGPSGSGKTRQAWAMLREARRQRLATGFHTEAAIPWVRQGHAWKPAQERSAWVLAQLGADTVWIRSAVADLDQDLRAWLQHPGWLVIDDLAVVPPVPSQRAQLYRIAGERRAWARPTLWATPQPPDALEAILGVPLAERLLAGVVLFLEERCPP